MKWKVTIFSRVPIKTRDISWRHDRRQDGWVMRRARMRKRGTGTKNKIKTSGEDFSRGRQIAAGDLNCQPVLETGGGFEG